MGLFVNKLVVVNDEARSKIQKSDIPVLVSSRFNVIPPITKSEIDANAVQQDKVARSRYMSDMSINTITTE